jgi:hypothetical protein
MKQRIPPMPKDLSRDWQAVYEKLVRSLGSWRTYHLFGQAKALLVDDEHLTLEFSGHPLIVREIAAEYFPDLCDASGCRVVYLFDTLGGKYCYDTREGAHEEDASQYLQSIKHFAAFKAGRP